MALSFRFSMILYHTLSLSLGIFESSIGECEEILGDIATQIDQIAVDVTLAEEERRRKLEQISGRAQEQGLSREKWF